jgi:hypothetical protein
MSSIRTGVCPISKQGALPLFTILESPGFLRGYPESYAALLFGYLKGDGFHASSGASLLNIPPMALILTQASLDSGNHS